MNLEIDLTEQLTSNAFNPPSNPIPKAFEDEEALFNYKTLNFNKSLRSQLTLNYCFLIYRQNHMITLLLLPFTLN